MNEIGNTTIIQPSSTRVTPSLGKIMRQPGGPERLGQTCLKRAFSDIEDEQDDSRPRLTYFVAASESFPDLAARPGAWQQPKSLSSSALSAVELHVLDEITRRKLFPCRRHTAESGHPARVPLGRNQRTAGHEFIMKPRLALFTPAHLTNGPRPESRKRQRGTHKFHRRSKSNECAP